MIKDIDTNTYTDDKFDHHPYNILVFNDIEVTLVKKI